MEKPEPSVRELWCGRIDFSMELSASYGCLEIAPALAEGIQLYLNQTSILPPCIKMAELLSKQADLQGYSMWSLDMVKRLVNLWLCIKMSQDRIH